jgi:hypothetical protein
MDDEIRWESRRGSIFSAPTESRRGSIFCAADLPSRRSSVASPSPVLRPHITIPEGVVPEGVVVELHHDDDGQGTVTSENGVILDADLTDDEDDEVVVAFCGSVMEKYHTFRQRCQTVLDELVSQRVETPVSPTKSPRSENGERHGDNRPLRLPTVVERRRVVLEGNGDGGILGAGILAAVVDTKELSASVDFIAATKS